MVWFGGTDKDWLGAECFIPGGARGDTGRSGQKGWAREREREERRGGGWSLVTLAHRAPGQMVKKIKMMGHIRIA